MKKSLLVLLAAVLLALPTMAQTERTDYAPAKSVTFSQVTPFNMTTRTGETINMQNLLSQGKTIIIDLSCCWCGPCWSFHQTGTLEYLHENYGAPGTDEFFIIWGEIEGSNTDAQITGTSTSSNQSGYTQGDWTNGGTVPYAIVDDASLSSHFDLYEGYVPTIFMIFPNGYYRDITSEIRSSTNPATAAAAVYAIKDFYPQAGQPPVIEVTGPTSLANGSTATFTVDYISVDPVTSIAWDFADGTPATASTATASTSWATSGNHTVIVSVSNANGTAYDTMIVNTFDCEAITALPVVLDLSQGLGCWSTYVADAANNDLFGIQDMSDGSQAFVFSSYNEANNYDQYLITPEINLTSDFALSFFYAVGSSYSSGEHFTVRYSTTGNGISDFTNVISDINATNGDWAEYTGIIPANAKYVAIKYDANYQYYLFLTDISLLEVTAPTVEIEGPASAFVNSPVTFNAVASMAESYSWTVDGNAVNETSNSLTYSFTTTGTHTVGVTVTNNLGSDNATFSINVKNYGDTLYYDNGQYASSVGTGGAIYWAILFEPAQLSNRNVVRDVLFYAPKSGNYTVSVREGNATAPQTTLSTQTANVSSSQAQNWNTVSFNNVTFDNTKHLWIVLNTSNIDYPAAGCAYTGNGNGSMVSMDGSSWMTIQQASSSLNYTWMVRAVIPNGVGINDIDNNVAIYPNPANDMLNVVAEGVKSIEIIDATGRVVLNTKNAGSIDISNLSNGIYMVRTITNEGVSMQKVIKK